MSEEKTSKTGPNSKKAAEPEIQVQIGGIPAEEHKLWLVPVQKDEPIPLVPRNFGTAGAYKVELLLSRPGYPITPEWEHKFVEGIVGDSHLKISKSVKERNPHTDADHVRLDTFVRGKKVTFVGLPNDQGFLGKLVVNEVTAENFQDAETQAYEAVAPWLSALALHLDIPAHVETIQVTELKTMAHSLRVRTPNLEMTFAGGISPILGDDFCHYASLYREGLNTNSSFYRFLCFYKVIESIPHRRSRLGQAAKDAGQEVRRFYEKIPADHKELSALLKVVYPWRNDWGGMALDQLLPDEACGKKIGWVREKYLNPLRVGIAHALLKTGEIRMTLDKIEHIQQINKWLPLCRVLARLMLHNEFPEEFALAMKPLTLTSE